MPTAKELEKLNKGELYEIAQEADIPGRSQMDRTELIDAVRQATRQGGTDKSGSTESGSKGSKGGRSGRSKHSEESESHEDSGRRALWKGAITFGLITIPVGLYSAVEERDIRFHMIDTRDGSRIRYQRVSATTGREVPRDDIVKGYEFEKDRYVTFTDEELERIPSESFRTIDVVQFADNDQIDPVSFQTTYYLAPEPSGTKAYALLAEALERSGPRGRVGLAKITLRNKERLAVIRARDGVMMLETMNWPDEIRTPPFNPADRPAASPKEVEMAQRLIDELTEDFDPSRFHDTYRERLEQAIQAKVEGEEISLAPEEAPRSEEVGDLMEALRASVEAARSRSGGKAKTG